MDEVEVDEVSNAFHSQNKPLIFQDLNVDKTEMVVFESFSDFPKVNVSVEFCNGINVILREHASSLKFIKVISSFKKSIIGFNTYSWTAYP